MRDVISIPNPAAGAEPFYKANRRIRVWSVACRLLNGEAGNLYPIVRVSDSGPIAQTANLALFVGITATPGTRDITWSAEGAVNTGVGVGQMLDCNQFGDVILEKEWCLQLLAPGLTVLSQFSNIRLVVEDVDDYGAYDGGEDEDDE